MPLSLAVADGCAGDSPRSPAHDLDLATRRPRILKTLGWSKKEFTKAWLATGHTEIPQSEGRTRDHRRGVWQSKFWEHAIRDEDDYARHIQYIHFNPVKHGYAKRPFDWRLSSFRAYVRMGMFDRDWGVQGKLVQDLDGMEGTVGE